MEEIKNEASLEFQQKCHDLTITEVLFLEDIIGRVFTQAKEAGRKEGYEEGYIQGIETGHGDGDLKR